MTLTASTRKCKEGCQVRDRSKGSNRSTIHPVVFKRYVLDMAAKVRSQASEQAWEARQSVSLLPFHRNSTSNLSLHLGGTLGPPPNPILRAYTPVMASTLHLGRAVGCLWLPWRNVWSKTCRCLWLVTCDLWLVTKGKKGLLSIVRQQSTRGRLVFLVQRPIIRVWL